MGEREAPRPRRVLVLRGALRRPDADPDTEVLTFEELRSRIVRLALGSFLLRWPEARLLTHRLDALTKPFNTALILRAISRGAARLEDERGDAVAVGPRLLAAWGRRALRDLAGRRGVLRQAAAAVREIERRRAARRLSGWEPGAERGPLYLRTDLIWGLRSGGSVGHIAGVLNNLGAFGGPPVFVTTDTVPTVSPAVETHVVPPPERFRDFAELPALWYAEPFARAAHGRLAGRVPSFVYQRYSLDNWSGAALATRIGVPFVLEYNGSEIWINRNWGTPLRHEAVAEAIELLCLRTADLVVVVSRPMRDELVARGVAGEKVLVNPNGVDPERYSPAVDGAAVRARYGLAGKVVIGFIGTFGRWHGAEVLAAAFARLLAQRPEDRERLRLLLIGDGVMMPQVRQALATGGVAEAAVLTGVVPQAEGPAHLAACDVLVASHVPNPDGTPFFGSPTKLFEYLAMGRGIVASDLDQIGEVLEHGRTAWLVRPGDATALAAGLRALADDPDLRARLGRAARAEALARHSWREHTGRIVAALRERCR